jgi:RNA polymerase sigma factor (sigma-70 family)
VGLRGVCGVNALAAWADEPSGEVAVVRVAPANFGEFYRSTRSQVARAVAMTIGDLQLADEAVDEAMTRAYARWSHVSTLDNPGGWVYRVALNWSRSTLRRLRRPQRAPHGPTATDEYTASEPAIARALAQLGVEQRAVVVCRYLLGWSEEQTATALGIRPGTVKSRASRAIKQLQSQLDHLRPEGHR